MTLSWREHIRPYYLEEPFDFFLFRPVALLVLQVLYPTSIGANQVSWFAMFVALASGFSLAQGTHVGFMLGGLGILVFSVLDCVDGMLARIRKNNGIMGEPLDIFVDMVAATSFFTGLSVGLARAEMPGLYWYMPIASGLIILFHAGTYQGFKKRFCFHRDGGGDVLENHLAKFLKYREELRAKGGHYLDRLLIFLLLASNKSQENLPREVDTGYVGRNRATLPLWAITAGSSHLGILGLSLLFGQLKFFFFFSFVLAQIILLIAFATQTAMAKQVRKPA